MGWRWSWCAGGWLLGTAVQLAQSRLSSALACGLAALGAGALLAWCGRPGPWRWRWMGCLALAVGAGGLAWSAVGWRAIAQQAQALAPALEGRDLQVEGVVAAMPQTTALGQRLRFRVQAAHWQGQPVALPPLIELVWYHSAAVGGDSHGDWQRQPGVLRAGQRWAFTVRLKAPHGAHNPQGFYYELWLWEQGVQATGYVRAGSKDPPPRLLAQTMEHPVEQLRQRVRDAILQRLAPPAVDAQAPDRARVAGVVAALVTGDQRAIERADWDVFRATGVAHLMSISGLHITAFAWVATALVGWLWRRSARACLWWPAPQAALVGGLALAASYAVFSGGGIPAQRTVGMLALVVLLRLSGRRWPWPQVWLMVAAAVVAWDPWALLQAGFWLSFVAVAVLFASDAAPTLRARPWRQRATERLRRFAREQWVMTWSLLPLTLLLFGQVSTVGALANLVAIPWVTVVVTPLALAGLLMPPLWQLAAWCMAPLVAWLQWLAAGSGAVLWLPAAPWWAASAAVVGGVVCVLRWPWPARVLGVPLLWPALFWQPPVPPPGRFELLAADVGQGNAVLVRTAGHALLYDAGPRYGAHSDAGGRTLVPLLRSQGVRLDRLVLSHRDSDHTGGALAVLAAHPQADLWGSVTQEAPLQAVRPVQPCVAGQHWQWDGVRFEVLHPPPAPDEAAPAGRPNAHSCVLRIVDAHGAAALLAGDIEVAQEQALQRSGAALAADVLLVPHHGSKTSSSVAFLEAVRPRTALVQSGYRNRFGHPAPEVAQRYAAQGVVLLNSPACGAMHWSSAQPAQWVCERERTARYWHHRVAG